MAVLNRLLAVLLGLALAVAGVVLVAETVAAAVSQPPLLVDRAMIDSRLAELSWTDWITDLTIAILIGLGALLLLLQLIPRPPDSLALKGGPGREAELERKPLASLLAARIDEDPEVLRARAKITPRAASVSAKAQPGADTRAMRPRLEATAKSLLEPLQLASPPRTKVRVSRTREKSL